MQLKYKIDKFKTENISLIATIQKQNEILESIQKKITELSAKNVNIINMEPSKNIFIGYIVPKKIHRYPHRIDEVAAI